MFANTFEDKKILVTGNTGFKGSWLTAWLLQLGAEVYGLSHKVPTEPSLFEVLNLREKTTLIEEDLRNYERVVEIVADIKPQFVFHLAAQPIVNISYQDPVSTFHINVLGTSYILDALRLSNHPCVGVIITSDKCYENLGWTWGYRENDRLGDKDPYGASKAAAEIVINAYYHSFFKKESSKVKIASARAGNVIGGGDWAIDRIVPDCMRAWSQGKAVEIRKPNSTRPWQHVLEPLSGYLRLAEMLQTQEGFNGEAYNFGPSDNENLTVLELLREVSKHWNFSGQKEIFVLGEKPGNPEAHILKLNCEKAFHELQWRAALDVKQAAAFTARWYDKYYHDPQGIFEFTREQILEYCDIAQKKGLTWIQKVSKALL